MSTGPRKTEARLPVKVLVVDDDLQLAEMLCESLKDVGFQCNITGSPVGALEALNHVQYDVLVTDLCMPEMSGVELMQNVKRSRPELPVLIMTAYGSVQAAVDAMQSGADDFIEKPFDIADFREKVESLSSRVKRAEAADAEGGLPSLPGYQMLDCLGRGAMGVVYLARHEKLERLVAVKVVRPDAFATPSELQRFEREARAAARMEHVNIIRVYSLIEHGGLLFLVMEYFQSRPASLVTSRIGQVHYRHVAQVGMQMARALVHASKRGIVHRDVKPGNILIGENWRAKLSDFGLAKERTVNVKRAPEMQTRAGSIVGTPAYLSPEQAMALEDLDVRSDIYGLGCSLYHMLTGEDPFTGDMQTLLRAHMTEPLPELTVPEVPEALREVVRKATAKERDARFQSAEEMYAALARSV